MNLPSSCPATSAARGQISPVRYLIQGFRPRHPDRAIDPDCGSPVSGDVRFLSPGTAAHPFPRSRLRLLLTKSPRSRVLIRIAGSVHRRPCVGKHNRPESHARILLTMRRLFFGYCATRVLANRLPGLRESRCHFPEALPMTSTGRTRRLLSPHPRSSGLNIHSP